MSFESSAPAPQNEVEALLREAIPSYDRKAQQPDWEAVRDQLFTSEFQEDLAAHGLKVGAFRSPKKFELHVMREEESAHDDQIRRVFVKTRATGPARIEVTRGRGEMPIEEFPLPSSIEEARTMIRFAVQRHLYQ